MTTTITLLDNDSPRHTGASFMYPLSQPRKGPVTLEVTGTFKNDFVVVQTWAGADWEDAFKLNASSANPYTFDTPCLAGIRAIHIGETGNLVKVTATF
jgi:hypothetical protein